MNIDGLSLDQSPKQSLDIVDDLTLRLCDHMSQFPELSPEQIELNRLIVNNLPIPFSRHNLLCLLMGFVFFFDESGESGELIDYVLSSPDLSAYFWRHCLEFRSLQDLISAFESEKQGDC